MRIFRAGNTLHVLALGFPAVPNLHVSFPCQILSEFSKRWLSPQQPFARDVGNELSLHKKLKRRKSAVCETLSWPARSRCISPGASMRLSDIAESSWLKRAMKQYPALAGVPQDLSDNRITSILLQFDEGTELTRKSISEEAWLSCKSTGPKKKLKPGNRI